MKSLLSVCIITYNHVNFIKQAIEGVLLQKVNFKFEIIIADDFSTDGTREIILDYEKKYPGLISLILQPKNVGPLKNWLDLIKKPKLKYIAYFEGDDYWTDHFKLQKQVDFLEKHHNYVICYHDVKILYPDGKIKSDFINKTNKTESSIYDLAVFGNYIHTCSIVFRNYINIIPDEVKIYLCDYLLYMELSKFGDIKKLPECMAIYRYGGGIWSQLSDGKKREFYLNNIINVIKTSNNDTIIKIMHLRMNEELYNDVAKDFKRVKNIREVYNSSNLAKKVNYYILIKALFIKLFFNVTNLYYLPKFKPKD